MSLLERVQAAGVLEEQPLGGQDRKRREQLRKALVDRLGLSAVARLVTEERPERAREELKAWSKRCSMTSWVWECCNL